VIVVFDMGGAILQVEMFVMKVLEFATFVELVGGTQVLVH
jgi:hypothetical protein